MQIRNITVSLALSAFFAAVLVVFGPAIASLALVGAVVTFLFLTQFETMFLGYLLLRPTLDLVAESGPRVGFSTFNAQSVVSLLLIIGSFCYLVGNKLTIRLPKEGVAYALFLVFALFGTLVHFEQVGWDGLATFLRLLTTLVVIIVIYTNFTVPEKLRSLWWCLGGSFLIPVCYALLQAFTGLNAGSREGITRVTGGLGHANGFGAWVGLFIILLYAVLHCGGGLSTRIRRRLGAAEWLLLFCLVLTYGRGAWLATLLTLLLVQLMFHRRGLLWTVAVLTTAIMVTYVGSRLNPSWIGLAERFKDVSVWKSWSALTQDNNSLGWRILYWRSLIGEGMHSPIIGHGLGSVIATTIKHVNAHNNYIQIFFETGLGVFCYFGLLWIFFRRAMRGVRQATDPFQRALCIGGIGMIIFYLILSVSNHLIRNTIFQLHFFTILTMMVCYDRLRIERYACSCSSVVSS